MRLEAYGFVGLSDLAAAAKEIEDTVYDLKAVNPHRKLFVDKRTPEDLIEIIDAKGKEIANALAELRVSERATR